MAYIIYVNSLAIINIPFRIHLAFHVHVGTLAMGYIYFEMHLTMFMVYIFILKHA
jgi:hypothetical protein